MGSHQYVYIGPYLKINKIPKSDVEKTIRVYSCSNTSCENHKINQLSSAYKHLKFCPECGSPNSNNTYKETLSESPSPWEIISEFGDENIFYPEENALIPNRKNGVSKHIVRISYDDGGMERSLSNSEEAITDFNKEYDSFIKFIDSKSIESEVKFGVISYWN